MKKKKIYSSKINEQKNALNSPEKKALEAQLEKNKENYIFIDGRGDPQHSKEILEKLNKLNDEDLSKSKSLKELNALKDKDLEEIIFEEGDDENSEDFSDFHGNEDYFSGIEECYNIEEEKRKYFEENFEEEFFDNYDDLTMKAKYKKEIAENAIKEELEELKDYQNFEDLEKEILEKEIVYKQIQEQKNLQIQKQDKDLDVSQKTVKKIKSQKLNEFDKKGTNQMSTENENKTKEKSDSLKQNKNQNFLGKHKKMILAAIGYAILLGGAFFGAVTMAKKEKAENVQVKQTQVQTQNIKQQTSSKATKQNEIQSSKPVEETKEKVKKLVENHVEQQPNSIQENADIELKSEEKVIEEVSISQNDLNAQSLKSLESSNDFSSETNDLDNELQELERRKAQLEAEREAFIQKEREMQERIEKAKREKQEKERQALIAKAKAKKEEALSRFDKNIADLTDEIVKKKEEIDNKNEELRTKLNQVHILFDKQISDLSEQSKIIAEQEEKLKALKAKQVENEKLIKSNFAKDVAMLEKEQQNLAKGKELEQYEKDVRAKIAKIKALKGIVEVASTEEVLNFDLESNDFKTLEAPEMEVKSIQMTERGQPDFNMDVNVSESKVVEEKENSEQVQEDDQENSHVSLGVNGSNSNLNLNDLDTSKIKKSTSGKMSEEEKENFIEEVKNLNENYDKNSKNLNLKKDEDNEVKTDWLGSTIKRSQDPNKYDRYGSWVEVKTKNKL